MEHLKQDIKNNNYKKAYLFYGEEHYLIDHYEALLKKNIMDISMMDMNLSVFTGKEITSEAIIDASETLPFFCEKRMVIINDSGLFATGRKNETENISKYLDDIPDSTIILFIESQIDKRNGLFKKISSIGRSIEFKTPSEKDLISFITKQVGKGGKTISQSNAILILRTIYNSMDNIDGEIKKLISYADSETEITSSHIKAVCIKSVEAKIFDLVAAIGNKNSTQALDEFSNLIQMKEPVVIILVMISRQIRMLFQCKYLLSKKMSQDAIASMLGLRSFIVRDCIKQSNNFSFQTLKEAFEDCLNTDVKIKSGKMNDKLAVEMFILKYCS